MKKLLFPSLLFLLVSCSIQKKVAKLTNSFILNDSAFANANVGISVYEPATNNFWYKHNSDKYFVPASNTKLLTCYAAMKYLGDSLVGLKYIENDTALYIQGTGDPSFLMDEYKNQPVNKFLQKNTKKIIWNNTNWREEHWGYGWSWTDFTTDYTQERSALPISYNTINFDEQVMQNKLSIDTEKIKNNLKIKFVNYFATRIKFEGGSINHFLVERDPFENIFTLKKSDKKNTDLVNFVPKDDFVKLYLAFQLKKEVSIENTLLFFNAHPPIIKIFSQPTDSILKPMMHRSDNFFAEQSLLMVSNEKLGYMNDEAIIDYIKKNDFVGMPQMPRWVDGSGLSRYNMVTPQSLVWLLQKMKNEFGMERLENVLATGGEGTLSSLYKKISGKIFAKTGTLSNHVALSGFLYTKKNKLLIFSILTSGYQGSANPVRKAVEKYLIHLYTNY
jgi:serine-type D-Ala-D-Ala carboxypeptidase/endopeptidase (penicillin-binding protein 4)